MIYADNAATTKLDPTAFEAMKPYLREEYGNASQPYSFSRSVKKALRTSREIIAQCIGASPEEIFFTSGGTESDNWAIKGILNKHEDALITSNIEHHAVLNSCRAMEREGYSAEYLSVDRDGIVSSERLKEVSTGGAKLVSIMTANNEIGTIEPIAELARIAHEQGAIFHTDAVQAVGHIPVDVNKLEVDMLSASGHKFNGPKGIGFLYIKNGTEINSFMNGGSQENGLRAGTENIASVIGMAAALNKHCEHMEEDTLLLKKLEEEFFSILNDSDLDYVRNGAKNHLPGNINISIRNDDGERILHRMDLMGICISTGSACDSVNTQISHVIRAIKVPEEYAKGTIRITFGTNNKAGDGIKTAEALLQVCKKK